MTEYSLPSQPTEAANTGSAIFRKRVRSGTPSYYQIIAKLPEALLLPSSEILSDDQKLVLRECIAAHKDGKLVDKLDLATRLNKTPEEIASLASGIYAKGMAYKRDCELSAQRIGDSVPSTTRMQR